MKSKFTVPVLASILILGALGYTQDVMAPPLIGPLPYENFDLSLPGTTFPSPFNGLEITFPLSGYFHFEDFEDTMFNEPGVTVTGTSVCITGTGFAGSCDAPGPHNFGQISTDSVDGDDGAINLWGNGISGPGIITNPTPHSHWASIPNPAINPLTYTFDNTGNVLCALPTHVGIVWTDGQGFVKFEAFDGNGNTLGSDSTYLPVPDNFKGQAPEDRFYGAVDLVNGISRIEITQLLPSGIEVDHLQYGIKQCPILPPQEIDASIDVKPTSCPNPLNVKSKGVLPVAILGSAELDVTDIDVSTILLEGVSPIRSEIEDVATPFGGVLEDELSCTTDGADGFDDLTLKFKTQDIIDAIGPVDDGEVVTLTLTGELNDTTPLSGQDNIIIKKKGK